ncbi:MAG: hypothetical protein COB04_03195 [Gammaproteobacteria bacterium]|nr:MAG: hypothetical protein COB04_03195 [Gammaproteobacteria bacterium]
MNSNWQQFLQQNGAIVKDGHVAHFSDPDHEFSLYQADNLLCDLSDMDLLSITGVDAKQFLQGQLTCDLEQVNDTQFQLGALCTPKGRTIASFRLIQLGDQYVLQTPSQMGAPTQQTLNKYIIFSKAETQLNTNQWVCFGLMGAQSHAILQSAVPDTDLPTLPNGMSTCTQPDFQGVRIIRDFSQYPRYLIIAPLDKANALWQTLQTQCQAISNQAWALQDIIAGYGQITPALSEQVLPHNLNYQAIEAVNFKKGCYTGQEVVARMQYKGKLKTQMFIAYADLSTAPEINQPLLNTDTGKTQGQIINVCQVSAQRYALLLTLPKEAINSTAYRINDQEAGTITIEPAPYAIT